MDMSKLKIRVSVDSSCESTILCPLAADERVH
jgi:hypothetical protein